MVTNTARTTLIRRFAPPSPGGRRTRSSLFANLDAAVPAIAGIQPPFADPAFTPAAIPSKFARMEVNDVLRKQPEAGDHFALNWNGFPDGESRSVVWELCQDMVALTPDRDRPDQGLRVAQSWPGAL